MSPVKLKMHFHIIFECKFALLCARFLHIFLLNFDRIFDDFRQILSRGVPLRPLGPPLGTLAGPSPIV